MSTPVAGPGGMSQRTDLAPGAQAMKQLNNADYGEQKAYQEQQSGAPMAATQGVPSGLAGLLGTGAPNVVPMGAPSGRPGESVTTAPPIADQKQQQDMQDMVNQLPVLTFMANLPGAAWGLRNLVRSIHGNS